MDIGDAMDELIEAHQDFVATIDNLLHSRNTYMDIRNMNTIETIIETCPELLATKCERNGFLPIHVAAKYCNTNNKTEMFVPLLTDIGMQYAVGGIKSRGGLLVQSGRFDTNALQLLARRQENSKNVFKVLKNAKPEPLFVKEDICDFGLLYYVIEGLIHRRVSFDSTIKMLDYIIDLNKDSLFFRYHSPDGTPLSFLVLEEFHNQSNNVRLKLVEYLLARAIRSRPSCLSIGGLFHMVNGKFVLARLIEQLGKHEIWDCIGHVLTNIPFTNGNGVRMILHQTIKYTPQYIGKAYERYPDSLYQRDKDNRLPIHIALDRGMKWCPALVAMLQVNQLHRKELDPVTKLPLLALAAKEPSCDLKTIHYLLRKNPRCVESAIKKKCFEKESKKSKKRKR